MQREQRSNGRSSIVRARAFPADRRRRRAGAVFAEGDVHENKNASFICLDGRWLHRRGLLRRAFFSADDALHVHDDDIVAPCESTSALQLNTRQNRIR